MEFDLFVQDSAPSLLYSQSCIYIYYDTTIFGKSIVDSNRITATKGNVINNPFYSLTLSDSLPNLLKIAITHSDSATLPTIGSSQQLCHLKVNLLAFNLTSLGAAFDTLAMANMSEYKSTPSGLEAPYDIVRVSGLRSGVEIDAQIANVTYTDSLLTFDMQVIGNPEEDFHDATINVSYNTNNFGTYVASNNNLNCTSSFYTAIYNFTPPVDISADTFAIQISTSYTFNGQFVATGTFPPVLPYSLIGYWSTIATCTLAIQSCCVDIAAPFLTIDTITADYTMYTIYEDSDGSGGYISQDDNNLYTQGTLTGYDNGGHNICVASRPTISSLYPTILPAGAFRVLTISGSHFGCDKGQVLFPDAVYGGYLSMHTQPPDIQLWTDNMIQTWVPSTQDYGDNDAAGSGYIRIVTANGDSTTFSSDSLYIPYAVSNIRYSATDHRAAYVGLLNQNAIGGYTFRIDTLSIRPQYKNAIIEAMNDWRCETGVNFTIGADTSLPGGASDLDGINSITFGIVDSGALSETSTAISRFRININGDSVAVIAGIDIIFNDTVTYDTTTYATPNATGVNTSGHGSLLGAARHEFGHGAGLLDGLNGFDLMFWRQSLQDNPQPINHDDQNGGLYILTNVDSNQIVSCFFRAVLKIVIHKSR